MAIKMYSRLLLLGIFILTASPALALPEKEAIEFIAQIEALMNRRNMDEIGRFYKFYTDKKALFVKESELVDPENPDKTIATESLSMNVEQYLAYLKGILSTPAKYSYSLKIESIELNDAQKTATIKLSAQDSSVSYGRDEEKNQDFSTYVLTTSNCNYSLGYKSAHYYILGMNCLERINKTVVY